MKKILCFMFVFMFFSTACFAEPYEYFDAALNWIGADPSLSRAEKEKIAQKYLDIFTQDVGQAISGGSYGVGGNLGLSELNISLSLKMSYQDVSKDNFIVGVSRESSIYYPILQADIGLLEKFDAIARLSYFNDSALFGGGLRYKILESEEKMYIPSVSAQSVFNYLIFDKDDFGKFHAWNLKTGATAYFGLVPYIQPYVFLTFDTTALNPGSSYFSHLSSLEHGFGYGAGANIKLNPLNINVSVSIYEGRSNVSFGAFVGI